MNTKKIPYIDQVDVTSDTYGTKILFRLANYELMWVREDDISRNHEKGYFAIKSKIWDRLEADQVVRASKWDGISKKQWIKDNCRN